MTPLLLAPPPFSRVLRRPRIFQLTSWGLALAIAWALLLGALWLMVHVW